MPLNPLEQPQTFAANVSRLSAARLAQAHCDSSDQTSDTHQTLDRAYPLTLDDALVILFCKSYAHNFSYLGIVASRSVPGRSRTIELPQLIAPVGHSQPTGEYMELDWDAERGVLTSDWLTAWHTIGDHEEWAFDGRGFVLSAKVTYAVGGADVLVVYRTTIKRDAEHETGSTKH